MVGQQEARDRVRRRRRVELVDVGLRQRRGRRAERRGRVDQAPQPAGRALQPGAHHDRAGRLGVQLEGGLEVVEDAGRAGRRCGRRRRRGGPRRGAACRRTARSATRTPAAWPRSPGPTTPTKSMPSSCSRSPSSEAETRSSGARRSPSRWSTAASPNASRPAVAWRWTSLPTHPASAAWRESATPWPSRPRPTSVAVNGAPAGPPPIAPPSPPTGCEVEPVQLPAPQAAPALQRDLPLHPQRHPRLAPRGDAPPGSAGCRAPGRTARLAGDLRALRGRQDPCSSQAAARTTGRSRAGRRSGPRRWPRRSAAG